MEKEKQQKQQQQKKKKKKNHDCNITKLIVRLCSGKTLTMLSMWFGLLEKAWLKFCFLADCQMWTHITVSSFEPSHDKTNKVTMRPAKTRISLGIRPVWSESSLYQISLGIRPVWSVFAVRMRKAWVFSYPLSARWRLWSDRADLSHHWTHSHFVGFVIRRLICYIGRVVRLQLAETSIKEWIVWEFYYVNPWMDVLNVHFSIELTSHLFSKVTGKYFTRMAGKSIGHFKNGRTSRS